MELSHVLHSQGLMTKSYCAKIRFLLKDDWNMFLIHLIRLLPAERTFERSESCIYLWLPTDQLRSNITAVWFVIAMPTCMAIYFGLVYLCRGRVDQWKEAEALVLRIVWDACNRYRLVADYFQRPQMNEAFSVASGSLRTRLWHNMAQDFLI